MLWTQLPQSQLPHRPPPRRLTVAPTAPLTNVDWLSIKHPLDCSTPGSSVEVLHTIYFDVTGDGVKEAFVQVDCTVMTGSASDQVEVFDGASALSAPRLIGILNPVAGAAKHTTKTITASGPLVTLSGVEWSTNAPGCCADIAWTQTYTWSGGKFQPGTTKRHPV
jgi:hypothetical protein